MKMLYIMNEAVAGATNFYATAAMAARELGMDFHVAFNCLDRDDAKTARLQNEMNLVFHQIDFVRNPFHLHNIRAYHQLLALVRREHYDIIHCNTPIGGALGRLAARRCGGKKVIYQAHGFHFYRGAPLLNWLLYYPVEWWLAHHTDAIITINHEDYERAQRFKLRKNGKVYYVPGVGLDVTQYKRTYDENQALRRALGIQDDDIMLISMGDLIERKNYETAIRAVAAAKNPTLKYCICGQGPLLSSLQTLCKRLGVEEWVHFLGFRSDIKALLQAADIFLLTSKQEGLPRSLLEAMASGLPCIASKIRGNVDLLEDGVGGYLCEPTDDINFSKRIQQLAGNAACRKQMGVENLRTILQYDISDVSKEINLIYTSELSGIFGGGG